ncbi:GGDEF domain-containing protein [Azospirillum sp.]|uniref:GGDEF domain-containing protein n=1 Tax=Azospirillum sp. TaxID=34012 RepID=UPI003D73E994
MHPPLAPDPPAAFDLFDPDDGADAVLTSRELSVTRSKLGDLLDLLPAGLLIHQEQGIVYANVEASRALGLSREALVGRHFLDFVADPDLPAQRALFAGCLHDGALVRTQDCVLIGADARQTSVQVSMSPLPWDGLPVLYVLINDVTALKQTEAMLRVLSNTDSLTGAWNRRHFIDLAEAEVERSRRYARPFSLLALDIDHFKRINDAHGHAVGDEALKAFTAACRTTLRTNDVLGRMGGEEFAILLPETDGKGARRVAERIRTRVRALTVPAGTDTVRFTVSIGWASCQGDGRDLDAMLSCADEALYRAKDQGRDRVVGAADVAFV